MGMSQVGAFGIHAEATVSPSKQCVWKTTKAQDNGDVWAGWKTVESKFKEVTGVEKPGVSFCWLYELEILTY